MKLLYYRYLGDFNYIGLIFLASFGQENGAHQRAGEKIKHGEIKRTSGEKTQRTKRQGEIIKKFRPSQIQRQSKTDPQEKRIFK